MIRMTMMLAVLGVVAACGVDGPPERPEPGVSVTGEARMGVVLK